MKTRDSNNTAGVRRRQGRRARGGFGGLWLLAWFGLLLGCAPAQAVRMAALFQAEVPAGGRDPQARQQALETALAEVLVRVTGDAKVAADPAAAALLKAPGRFVTQFRFHAPPPEPPDPAAAQRAGLMLWAQFDEVALTRALRTAGLPVWGRERPEVLLWFAVEGPDGRRLLSDAAGDRLAKVLRRAARRYGLPLVLPLMDLDDQRQVRFSDVWGGFLSGVEQASARYASQHVLVGRLQPVAGGWRVRWTLLGGARRQWQSDAADPGAALENGLGQVAGWLAGQYAVVATTEPGRQLLTVEGLDSLSAYARVLAYLEKLDIVAAVQVDEVSRGRVRFVLELDAPAERLLRLIRLGRVLEPVDTFSWVFRPVR